MKRNQLPLYALLGVIALALIWRVLNPPPPQLPGPVGEFPTWRSGIVHGTMACHSANAAGTMWAGGWNDTSPDRKQTQSALRIIDFAGFSGLACSLGKDEAVQYLGWADDHTLRALCTKPDGSAEIITVDAATGDKKSTVPLSVHVLRVLCWPAGSNDLAAVTQQSDKSLTITVASQSGKPVGKDISVDMPSGGAAGSLAGLSADGSELVFSVLDSRAKDGVSFYAADTSAGTAKQIFDLGDVPGRIEGIWPSSAGVLMVCRTKETLGDVLYKPEGEKTESQPNGIDLSKWPGAPKSIGYMSYTTNAAFDLATGKTKTLIDLKKNDSATEKQWRNFLRDSRTYAVRDRGFVAISESSGAIDIREIKPDGSVGRPLISRM